MRKYYEVQIFPSPNGFGEYVRECGKHDFWPYEEELVDIMEEDCDLYELGKDDLPEGVKDIRGLIHDEPPRVFWAVCFGDTENGRYIGIDYEEVDMEEWHNELV